MRALLVAVILLVVVLAGCEGAPARTAAGLTPAVPPITATPLSEVVTVAPVAQTMGVVLMQSTVQPSDPAEATHVAAAFTATAGTYEGTPTPVQPTLTEAPAAAPPTPESPVSEGGTHGVRVVLPEAGAPREVGEEPDLGGGEVGWGR